MDEQLEKQVQVGDIIKSYDFPGNVDCYMIGKVVDFESDGEIIVAKMIKVVFDGVELLNTEVDLFRTPQQGLCMFDSKFERVARVG